MEMKSQKGQALVFTAFGLLILMGIMGLAIDMGHLRSVKRDMQTAADAAAIAAAGEIDYGDWNNAGLNASSKNGYANGANGVTVTITHPPATGDPHAGNNFYVQASVAQSVPTYFAKIFGIPTISMTTKSEAAEGGGTNCIFALNPSGTGLSVVALAAINSACGIVVESSGSNAITCALLAAINASSIGVVGNVGTFLCTINPTPVKIKVPNPADPLATWAAANTPSSPPGSCGTSTATPYFGSNSRVTVSGATTYLFHPGTYCGGINFAFGGKATFLPGLYILKSVNNAGATLNPAGLSVDLGTTITGNGVTFYNLGPGGAITFLFSSFTSGGVNLVAPTSGAYEGVLFWQPSGNTNAAQIIGTSSFNTTLEGSYYFPTATVNFAFSGSVHYNILVAKVINFAVFTFGSTTFNTSGFTKDYTTLADGSPVKGQYGVLVE